MNTYSAKFDTSKTQEYKALFEKENATFCTPQYMYFQARGEGFTASFYQSGKFVIQGKNTDKIISKYFGENPTPKQDILNIAYPHVGIDESGKGDFFGPLVIAGAYLTQENAKKLQELGVCDSKKLSDKKILELEKEIKSISIFEVVVINPKKYNELYSNFKNLNKLLAWGHATVLENILKKTDAKIAISDQFAANENVILSALKEKGKTKILRLYICPLFSSTLQTRENIKGIVLFCIDTTEQKNLETQFVQAQKMQGMGQIAGGIAHDFNNLLTAMIGFCDLLLQKHSIGDSSFADIIQIKQNANCAAELVRQLLQFSRKQPLQPELSDITDILINYTPLLKRTVGEQIELKFHHGENLDCIKVDKVQFLQVILNLCVNAKDAMNKKGALTISTHKETLLEPYHFGAETIESGNFIRMDVTDTGCGIPPTIRYSR